MKYTEKQLAKYRNGNTLLSYFKYQLARRGYSVKYFSRDFLATFISEYNASHKNGFASYPDTIKSDFYNKNGGSYCAFLEIHAEYNAAIRKA